MPQRGIVRNFPAEAMAVRVLCLLGWLLLIPALLLTAFLGAAENGALYGRIQDAYVDERSSGISDAERYRLNDALAACIRGEADALNVRATVWGVEQPAFNETEIAHMADVQALFVLARRVRMGLLIAGAALLAAGRRRGVVGGYFAALGVWLALLLGGALWTAADFTRAFTLFHKCLFTNELWLLNPATDLMIRMLPEAFFADFAAVALITMAAVLIAVGAVLVLGRALWKRLCA